MPGSIIDRGSKYVRRSKVRDSTAQSATNISTLKFYNKYRAGLFSHFNLQLHSSI